MRDAATIPYGARVDAIWLTDGDVPLAARLLRTTPDSLMQSFASAEDALVAFCERPENWLPEHSLASSFGARSAVGHSFDLDISRDPKAPFVTARVLCPNTGAAFPVGTFQYHDQRWTWEPSSTFAARHPEVPLHRSQAAQEAAHLVVMEINRELMEANPPELVVTVTAA